jgi:hypothetical protein
MPYCTNCRDMYTAADNYCRKCGRPLNAAAGTMPSIAGGDHLASSFERAIERTDDRRRRTRNAREGSNEGLHLYVSCIGIIAFVHGLSLMMGGAIAKLLDGPIGLLMVAGIVFGVVFRVIFDMRLGYSLGRSLVETILIGAFVYGAMYGLFWYLNAMIAHSNQPLFNLPGVSTPTPKP